jgi:hypothetical protein
VCVWGGEGDIHRSVGLGFGCVVGWVVDGFGLIWLALVGRLGMLGDWIRWVGVDAVNGLVGWCGVVCMG